MAYQGNLLSKTLVIEIIILFIGMSVVPSTGNLIKSSFICKSNNPPYEPSNPYPPGPPGDPIPIDVNLSWDGGDPDPEDNVTYDVFFGKWAPGEKPPLVATVGPYPANQTRIWYDIPGVLEFNRKYCWRIVAWDNHGASNSSPIWCFTTEPNYPPDPAHNPIPPDGENNVPGDTILYWNGSDPNSGDTLRYDVFFCICYPTVLVSQNQTENSYDPYGSTGDMPLFEEFYWRIVTWDRDDLHTSSPIWSFKTGINHKPSIVIDGPTRGRPGITYYYNFTIDDEDGHFLMLLIDWDDGTTTDWIGPFEPGETITVGHSWEEKGTYIITAEAEDQYGEPIRSEHKMTIPRYK